MAKNNPGLLYRSALLASVSPLFTLAPAVVAAQDKYAISAELRIENKGKVDLGSREIDILIVYDGRSESKFTITQNPQSIAIKDAPQRQSIELRRLVYDDLVPAWPLRFTPQDPDFEEPWFNAVPGDNTVPYKVVLAPPIARYKNDIAKLEDVKIVGRNDFVEKLKLITEAELYLPNPPQGDDVPTVVDHYLDRAEYLAGAYRVGELLHASAPTSLLHDFEQKAAKHLPVADRQRIFVAIGLAISTAGDLKANVGATDEQLIDVALRSFNLAAQYFADGDSSQDAFKKTYHAAARAASRAGEPLKGLVALDRMFASPDLAEDRIPAFTDVQRALILESLDLYGEIIIDSTRGKKLEERYVREMSNECGGFNAAWSTYAKLLLKYRTLGLGQDLEDSLELGQKIVGG